MNGGVHRASNGVEPRELLAAGDGHEFFGFQDGTAFFGRPLLFGPFQRDR